MAIDNSILFKQHAGRISAIAVLLSLSIYLGFITPREEKLTWSALTIWSIASLVLINLLRLELMLAYIRKKLPPGERGFPLFGSISAFVNNTRKHGEENIKKHGLLYTDKLLGWLPDVVINHSDDLSWLWNTERKQQSHISWPPHVQALVGSGSVTNSIGKQHKILRRMLEPAFAPNTTKSYILDMDEVVLKYLSTLEKAGTFHSTFVFKLLALRIFWVAAFGEENESSIKKFHDNFTVWLKGFESFVPLRIPGTTFYKAMSARSRILEEIDIVIDRFRAENPPGSVNAKHTMMGRICYTESEDGVSMKRSDLRDNILTVAFAGHDTTFFSLGTALKHLDDHPEIRDELVKEVKGFQEPLDFDELKNAPILNAFITESWRMEPPINYAFRKLNTGLRYKGYSFPKNLVVRYSFNSIAKNGDVYPSPDTFDIQRFLPEGHALKSSANYPTINMSAMKSSIYPVFGGGLHGCLGSHFAKLELRVVLTRMLQKYSVEVKETEKVGFPVNGWRAAFKLTKL